MHMARAQFVTNIQRHVERAKRARNVTSRSSQRHVEQSVFDKNRGYTMSRLEAINVKSNKAKQLQLVYELACLMSLQYYSRNCITNRSM